jgi:hypothetical protein
MKVFKQTTLTRNEIFKILQCAEIPMQQFLYLIQSSCHIMGKIVLLIKFMNKKKPG